MAHSRSQASKGSEKRKRDKADLEDSSHKKRKHGKADKAKAKGNAADEEFVDTGDADSVAGDSISNRGGRDTRENGDRLATKALHKWRISEPMGGRMSDVEPIFSADEK